MDYDKPRGAATGGGELTEMERQALDLYVITPRALPGVMHMIDKMDKVDALTAFHEKGSVVEPFEDATGGGPFGNQQGFTCEQASSKCLRPPTTAPAATRWAIPSGLKRRPHAEEGLSAALWRSGACLKATHCTAFGH